MKSVQAFVLLAVFVFLCYVQADDDNTTDSAVTEVPKNPTTVSGVAAVSVIPVFVYTMMAVAGYFTK